MAGPENVRKQTTWGGAAGIALLGFALVYRFFPDVIHVSPGVRPTSVALHTGAPPPPIDVRANAMPVTEFGPPRELATIEGPPAPELPQEPEVPATANVAALLKQADKALADGHLFEPADGSALLLYQQVLDEEKSNRRARAGRLAAQDSLAGLIGAALDQGDSAEAERVVAALDKLPHDAERFAELRARVKLARTLEPLLANAAELLKQGRGLEPAGSSALDVYRQHL